MLEVGIDRLLFSVDWPFMDNEPGVRWLDSLPLAAEDIDKLAHANARRLLRL
jgi:2,3-dihydroxybenzoate decarboxylase